MAGKGAYQKIPPNPNHRTVHPDRDPERDLSIWDPFCTALLVSRCPDRCRKHLDEALAWPVVKATKNAEVRVGRFEGSPVISLVWSQSFPLRYL